MLIQKKIMGYDVSKSLASPGVEAALKMAIKKGLILNVS